jgi:hypothetical protein
MCHQSYERAHEVDSKISPLIEFKAYFSNWLSYNKTGVWGGVMSSDRIAA